MIQYILELVAFQLVFLMIYDFWLKRETFFQWNRVYLISTYVLAMILPWVKIEALKTTVPDTYYVFPEFLWNANDLAVSAVVETESEGISISWEYVVFFGGMILASLFFIYKIRQLYLLKQKGEVHRFAEFTQIIIANSQVAFSFFKSIFIGDRVLEQDYKRVIEHELVHIKQKHTYDLLFFESMRILCWFNPLVYVYQNRVAELHEFIADAQVAKTNKVAQYQLLLSQVFETQHISFINQFFKTSLIKKRIVMLQKTQSKKIWQLKYLLLVPMVLGMLIYTSSAQEVDTKNEELSEVQTSEDAKLIEEINEWIDNESELNLDNFYKELINKELDKNYTRTKDEFFKVVLLFERDMKRTIAEDYKRRGSAEPILDRISELPSTMLYENDLAWKKARSIWDSNLLYSVGINDYNLRIIKKEDQNLGPGEFIRVKDLSDLTGSEIERVNHALATLKDRGRMLLLFDQENSFLIRRNAPEKYNPAEGKLFELIEKKQRKKYDSIARETKSVPFAFVEQVPIFPGCENAENKRDCFRSSMQEHIAKHFKYPTEAQKEGIQGRVSIMFTIDEEGNITKIRKRGPAKSLESEAERIIKLLPRMQAGKHKGKAVKVPFSIPISFKLNSEAKQNKE